MALFKNSVLLALVMKIVFKFAGISLSFNFLYFSFFASSSGFAAPGPGGFAAPGDFAGGFAETGGGCAPGFAQALPLLVLLVLLGLVFFYHLLITGYRYNVSNPMYECIKMANGLFLVL